MKIEIKTYLSETIAIYENVDNISENPLWFVIIIGDSSVFIKLSDIQTMKITKEPDK